MSSFVKRRELPAPGSIPEALQMFRSEVRFYREIAAVVGLRVPDCYRTEDDDDGTLLVLEDLSGWRPGADPVAAARLLASMHARWSGVAAERWPWLRPVGAATELVGELFDKTWPTLASRSDCTPAVHALGARLVGRVPEAEWKVAGAGPTTLAHGDASTLNMRTGPDGEIAVLDWEDVGAAPGVADLAWLLVSSVDPAAWDETIAAYGDGTGLIDVLPAVAVQGLLSFADTTQGSRDATGWAARLEAAARLLG